MSGATVDLAEMLKTVGLTKCGWFEDARPVEAIVIFKTASMEHGSSGIHVVKSPGLNEFEIIGVLRVAERLELDWQAQEDESN